jgi:hypothetical protein
MFQSKEEGPPKTTTVRGTLVAELETKSKKRVEPSTRPASK